jgi:hypothetical protein
MRLFHYTNPAGLIGIIQHKCFWVSQIQFLNDAKEFVHGVDVARHEVHLRMSNVNYAPTKELRALHEGMLRTLESSYGARTFVFSLSEEGDLLSQWRAYCPEGGFSIGMNGDQVHRVATAQGFRLQPCVYDPDEQTQIMSELITRAERDFLAKPKTDDPDSDATAYCLSHFYGQIYYAACTLKHPSFAEEREWRLIGGPWSYIHSQLRWRARGGKLIPYYEFSLTAGGATLGDLIKWVNVGPCPEPSWQSDAVESLLAHHGLRTQVHQSVTPYRTHW